MAGTVIIPQLITKVNTKVEKGNHFVELTKNAGEELEGGERWQMGHWKGKPNRQFFSLELDRYAVIEKLVAALNTELMSLYSFQTTKRRKLSYFFILECFDRLIECTESDEHLQQFREYIQRQFQQPTEEDEEEGR